MISLVTQLILFHVDQSWRHDGKSRHKGTQRYWSKYWPRGFDWTKNTRSPVKQFLATIFFLTRVVFTKLSNLVWPGNYCFWRCWRSEFGCFFSCLLFEKFEHWYCTFRCFFSALFALVIIRFVHFVVHVFAGVFGWKHLLFGCCVWDYLLVAFFVLMWLFHVLNLCHFYCAYNDISLVFLRIFSLACFADLLFVLRQSMIFKSLVFCCCLIVTSSYFAHVFPFVIVLRLCCIFLAFCICLRVLVGDQKSRLFGAFCCDFNSVCVEEVFIVLSPFLAV